LPLRIGVPYQPFSFILRTKGTRTTAQNENGRIQYSNSDFNKVIEKAINDVVSIGGGNILLRAGTHKITTAISREKEDNVAIYGEGRQTLLQLQANTYINIIQLRGCKGWIISNLRIDGARANNPDQGELENQHAIWVGASEDKTQSKHCKFSKLWLENVRRYGIRCSASNLAGLWVRDDTFHEIKLLTAINVRRAVGFSGLNKNICIGSTFENEDYGSNCEDTASYNVFGFNHVKGSGQGIYFGGGTPEYNVAAGNTMEAVTSLFTSLAGNNNVYALNTLKGDQTTDGVHISGNYNTIVGNRLSSFVKGIVVKGNGNVIDANTISDCTYNAIHVQTGATDNIVGPGNRYINITWAHVKDEGSKTRIHGLARGAYGVGVPPTAGDWEVGDIVRNTDDNTLWIKCADGVMRQLA